jgi:hypothetical protein
VSSSLPSSLSPGDIIQDFGDLKTFLFRVLNDAEDEQEVLAVLMDKRVKLLDVPNITYAASTPKHRQVCVPFE